MMSEPSIEDSAADGGSNDEKVAGMKVAEAAIPPVLRGEREDIVNNFPLAEKFVWRERRT
jgi:hypothetical protein